MKLLTEQEIFIRGLEIKEHPPTLVLETTNNGTWIFDWNLHFSHTIFNQDVETPRIVIFFNTHKITWEGINLQSMIDPLAKKGISKIREAPEEYHPIGEENIYIHQIKIEERS